MPVGLIGSGCFVPPTVIPNSTIAEWSGAEPEWIAERTGVETRHYITPGTATSDLAVEAARSALTGADRDGLDDNGQSLGLIVVATSTPDQPQPSTAAIVQHKLGLTEVPAFDVNAVCCGFIYALAVAEAMLSTRLSGQRGLVIGADIYSTLMDRSDRRTVSLFGDGAGAVLLGPVPDGYGVNAIQLATHGEHRDYVEVVAGGTRRPADDAARQAGEHLFRMQGRPVRDYALRTLPKVIGAALDQAGLALHDIDRFVFHQANTRLVQACARELGLSADRVPLTAPQFGNTAAASIPMALHTEHRRRPFRRGDRLVLAGVGGGMTAGAIVLTWY
jgi:3-oxoacyl-[acyl-carrier-protein] synthase-3